MRMRNIFILFWNCFVISFTNLGKWVLFTFLDFVILFVDYVNVLREYITESFFDIIIQIVADHLFISQSELLKQYEIDYYIFCYSFSLLEYCVLYIDNNTVLQAILSLLTRCIQDDLPSIIIEFICEMHSALFHFHCDNVSRFSLLF